MKFCGISSTSEEIFSKEMIESCEADKANKEEEQEKHKKEEKFGV